LAGYLLEEVDAAKTQVIDAAAGVEQMIGVNE
jgi:hypothetical protein